MILSQVNPGPDRNGLAHQLIKKNDELINIFYLTPPLQIYYAGMALCFKILTYSSVRENHPIKGGRYAKEV